MTVSCFLSGGCIFFQKLQNHETDFSASSAAAPGKSTPSPGKQSAEGIGLVEIDAPRPWISGKKLALVERGWGMSGG
ncbi:MAG: hypothetical protein J6Y80_04790 [Victivallales bacterium]|nr:hypothetical protein [Victivallales bacterium]